MIPLTENHLRRILNHGIPIVMYDRSCDDIKTDKVTVDDYETGAEFMIKADIKGVGGNDSNGVIFIKLME